MASMIMYHPTREFCRGCLSNNNLAPMNQTRLMHQEGLMLNVWPAFLEISGVNGFFETCPPLICNACVTALETVVKFRRNAQRTDEVLKNILLPGVQAAITINSSTQTPNRAPMRDAFTQVGQAVGYNEVAIQTEGGLYDFEPQSPIYSSFADPEAHETTTSESFVTVVERNDSSASTLCYVSHINSPSNFFVQFANESAKLESVSQTLYESDLEPLSSDQIESGVRCVAKYPVDGFFYRAEILSVANDGQISVTFSDFGNTSPVTDLRQLPESLTFPNLAIACKLDLPAGKVWAKWATNLFVEMAQDGDTEFEIEVLEDGERCLVKLSVDDENVGDNLMIIDELRRSLVLEPVLEEAEDESEDEEANTDDAASVIEALLHLVRAVDASKRTIAEEDGDTTEKGVSSRERGHDVPTKDDSTGSSSSTEGCDKAQVVNVNSINDFHVTLQDDLDDLSKICQAMLNEDHTFEKLIGLPSINSIVASSFEGHFYRVLVIAEANKEGGFYVEFLDFGHKTVSNEFRKLPDYLADLPAMAVRCCLAIESRMAWTESKVNRFCELCLAHDWFDIRVIMTEERCMTVQLYFNGRTIEEIIEAEFTTIANQLVFPIMPANNG